MLDFLVQIIAYTFAALLVLGIIGLAIGMLGMLFSSLSGKKNGAPFGNLPWWVWWTSARRD